MLRKAKTDDAESYVQTDEFKNTMYEVREGILFYGSPKVITTYSDWLLKASDETQSQKQTFQSIGAIFLAMRKDVGLSNFGLDSLSIHQLYVTDDLSDLK